MERCWLLLIIERKSSFFFCSFEDDSIFRNCENLSSIFLFLFSFFFQSRAHRNFFFLRRNEESIFSNQPSIVDSISRSRLRLIFHQQSTRISRIPLHFRLFRTNIYNTLKKKREGTRESKHAESQQ